MPQQFGGAIPKEHLNPRELPNWAETFSQIVVARTTAARLIWVSGQVAVDADNRIVGPGDLAQQAEYAFGNLAMALEAAGASLDDVVRLGIYVKNLRQEDGAVIRKALRRVFVRDTLPTSTWLGVTSLALDELVATQILTTPGVELVGPLPQELRITSSFVGAISSQAQAPEAARDLMAFLKTPAAVKVMRAQGMEPLFYGAQRTVLGTWSVVRPG